MARNMLSARSPQMPAGTEVAAFRTHEEASAAVEVLAENEFPITSVTIVGSGLHLAERILGKMTPAKVALSGGTQGITWGLMMAIMAILFYPQATALLPIVLVAVGVLLGVLMSTLSWALGKKRSPFAIQSTMVASRYAVLVSEMPDRAFSLLEGAEGNLNAHPRRPVRREQVEVQVSTEVAPPAQGDERWTAVSQTVGRPDSVVEAVEEDSLKPTEYGSRPDEAPRFGVRLNESEKTPENKSSN